MEPIGLGIIGCGVIGNMHLRAAAQCPLVKVVAIADLVEERRQQAAASYGIAKAYVDGHDLIEEPGVEAVVLALPTVGRQSFVLHALDRGLHVLTEKPIAMNAGEVQEMLAAQGGAVVACCSSRLRFLPSAEAIANYIASGALGELRLLRARAISAARPRPDVLPPAWRLRTALNGGGILVNWGCYELDYLLGVTGWSLKPEAVLSQTWPMPPAYLSHVVPGSDAETHYAAMVRCAGGAVITLERGEYVPARADGAWQIIGSTGAIQMDILSAENKQVLCECASADQGVTTDVLWQGNDVADAASRGPLPDFAQAIRAGRPPKTGLKESLIIQQITDAIYASARLGTAVEIG